MANYDVIWKANDGISQDDSKHPCRQVYVWLFTKDHQVVIVSKDGDNWQLPGGKPEAGETIRQTAVREVFEETGLDVSPAADEVEAFGYYLVVEPDNNDETYLQIRCQLKIDQSADQLKLHVEAEDDSQPSEDAIKYVKSVPFNNITELIPWMSKSGEYQHLVKSK